MAERIKIGGKREDGKSRVKHFVSKKSHKEKIIDISKPTIFRIAHRSSAKYISS
jgi:hypothetical protein